MMNSFEDNKLMVLPMIPLRGITVFPHMTIHFDVGRKKSVAALEKAMEGDQLIFLASQKDATMDEPREEDIYTTDGQGACGRRTQGRAPFICR
jgi:ATP-dependent Lon protease